MTRVKYVIYYSGAICPYSRQEQWVATWTERIAFLQVGCIRKYTCSLKSIKNSWISKRVKSHCHHETDFTLRQVLWAIGRYSASDGALIVSLDLNCIWMWGLHIVYIFDVHIICTECYLARTTQCMGYGASWEGDIDSVTLFTGNITARNNTLETKLISLCAAIIIPAFYFAFTDSKDPCSTTLARYALCHTITAVPGGRVIGAPVHKIIWYTEPRITIFWNEIYNHNEANNGQKKIHFNIVSVFMYLHGYHCFRAGQDQGGPRWDTLTKNQSQPNCLILCYVISKGL